MSIEEPSHKVTLSTMYEKLESVDDNVKLLLQRELDMNLGPRVSRLEKIVYFAVIPIGGLATAVLGIDTLVTPIF